MIKIKFIGYSDLYKRYGSERVNYALDKGLQKASKLAFKSLKKETPVDTGTLRKGWRIDTGDLVYIIKNRTRYAGYVNYGTRFQTANPYLTRGVENIMPKIKKIMIDEIIEIFKP